MLVLRSRGQAQVLIKNFTLNEQPLPRMDGLGKELRTVIWLPVINVLSEGRLPSWSAAPWHSQPTPSCHISAFTGWHSSLITNPLPPISSFSGPGRRGTHESLTLTQIDEGSPFSSKLNNHIHHPWFPWLLLGTQKQNSTNTPLGIFSYPRVLWPV